MMAVTHTTDGKVREAAPEKRWMDLKRMHNLPGKLFFSCLGIVLISLGAAICNLGGVGVDPFTAMNMGAAEVFGLRFGTYQVIVNLVILAIAFFLDRTQLGIGTLVNMVAVGYLIEFFTWAYLFVPQLPEGVVRSAVHLVAGTLVFTLGVSMYLKTRMGVSPIDAVAPIAVKLTGAPYVVCRVIQDIAVTVIAFFVGGPVGIFTIVAAFFTGPLITAWNKFVTLPLYRKTSTLDRGELDEEARLLAKRPRKAGAAA